MKKIVSVMACAVLCLSFAGCKSEDDSKPVIQIPILDSKEENFETVVAEVGNITKSYTLQGKFTYPYSSYLSVKKGGVIKESHIDSKEEIKKGDLLLEFECDEFNDQIESQEQRVKDAQKNLDDIKKSGGSKAKINVATVDLELEQNRLDILNAKLDDYKVYATMDGYIELEGLAEDYAVGKTLDDGHYLGKLIDRSEKVLTGSFFGSAQDRLSGVEFGTKVSIKQGNVAQSTGYVKDIVFHDNRDFSTFDYLIEIDDKNEEFYDFGQIDIVFNVYEKENVVTVPSETIVNVGSRTFVYTIVDGIRIETDVEVGIVDELNGKTEITSGLSGGETIVI